MSSVAGGGAGADSVRLDYDGSGNVTYVGLAVPNATNNLPMWQIRQFTYDGSGNLTSTLWADGNRNFDNIWDNRAGLSYS